MPDLSSKKNMLFISMGGSSLFLLTYKLINYSDNLVRMRYRLKLKNCFFCGCLDKNVSVIKKGTYESACAHGDIFDSCNSGLGKFFVKKIYKIYIYDTFRSNNRNGKIP